LGNVGPISPDNGFIYPLTVGGIGNKWTDSSKTSYNIKQDEIAEFKCSDTHTLWDTEKSVTQKPQSYAKIEKTCAGGKDITPLTGLIKVSCKKHCYAKGMDNSKMLGADASKQIKYNDSVSYSCITGYTLHKKNKSSGKDTYTKHNTDTLDIKCDDSGTIDPNINFECTKDCSYNPTAKNPNLDINRTSTDPKKMITNDTVTLTCTDKDTHQLFNNNVIVPSPHDLLSPSIYATCNANGSYSFTDTKDNPSSINNINGNNIQCKKIYTLDNYQVIPNGNNVLGLWSDPPSEV